ncbi:helix-turn-helix domain-containing protein [Niveispirillum sp.]|uniref:helix-turn-helix domain-containing protein n=1 Tax=Niveispirillum sp. TaxID=1917217 RepID=UPI001B5473B0|nr:XRE family transcriptional regulator [Niveispirillum sp.]MBP7339136.1 helix-turn-helix transcriptional regulator [Niveispirillum sp.]
MTINHTTLLGQRVKAIRTAKKLRIADVAGRAGLSGSTISKVENGQMSMTYDKLIQLAEGLDVELSALFSGEDAQGGGGGSRPAITGRRDMSDVEGGTYVKTQWYEYWYLCPNFSHKDMVPILGRTTARSLAEFGPLMRHPGQEFLFILSGEMDVYTEFYEPTRLKAGQSMYFDSSMGHAYISVSEEPCRFMTVCSSGKEPQP